MSRRQPGSGAIERTDSGKWRFRLTLADGTRRSSPPFDTEAEAQAELDGALYHLRAGAVAAVGALTLDAFGASWIDRRHVANAKTETGLWKHHIAGSPLAALPVAEIRRRDIREWALALAKKRKLVQTIGGGREPGPDLISPQTCRLCFALLRSCLSAAVEDEIIAVNPAADLRLSFGDADPDDDDNWTFLDEAEIKLVLAIPDAMARLHFQWAMGSGARQGESWGHQWKDIDLKSPEAVIRRSYRGRTKNGKPRRFPLFGLALDALRQWKEIAPDTRPDALVWPSRTGDMRARGDSMGWADRKRGKMGVAHGYKTRAGITRPVVYHTLRHTCASHLIMGTWGRRWSLEEVKEYLGHSDIKVTQRYGHLSPGHLHKIAAETILPGLPPRPVEVLPGATFLASPVGDRGATRTRDLLFRNNDEVRAVQGVRPDPGPKRDQLERGEVERTALAIITLTASGLDVPACFGAS